MTPRWTVLPFLLVASSFAADPPPSPALRAGALAVDISPTRFPVIVNAMFTERSADKVVDPLLAKALVLEEGTTRLALCVVDSCMVPRDLLDRAKDLATAATGIPPERILISATHTHSAPSAMGCLGSRADPEYSAGLPPRIAAAIIGANARLVPARVGWTAVDDWHHTFNRRWIRRPDRVMPDPFGAPTVRAHMHPGHQSPDAVGPSGPVDPGLTILAVTTSTGQPLAVLANYSQHYCGSPLLSSDYYGRFAGHLGRALGADTNFVGIMSQGTSGDQMWMDYGAPARDIGYDAYAKEISDRVVEAYRQITWHEQAALRMAERKLPLRYRVPDAGRLAWARTLTAAIGSRLPATQPEIYAWEAIYLHERQQTELKLQAVRIGNFGIAAIPNEVFAITGLKLKLQSPLSPLMNVELANGAEGYIPPPEQHKLGGYTTWPARTAGLESQAEPRIVATLLSLLEEVAGRPRRPLPITHGPAAQAVLDAKPVAYWRLDEMSVPAAVDATGHGYDATYEDGVALYLPGAGSGTGVSPQPALQASRFSGPLVNRAPHFAGGRVHARVALPASYSVEFWVWNGLPTNLRDVTGYAFSRGPAGDPAARGDHVGIGGKLRPEHAGHLFVFNGNDRRQLLVGRTILAQRAWHHVAFVREGQRIRVHLDGHPEPEIEGDLANTLPSGTEDLFLGSRNDGLFGLEGRLDEVAVYDRALTPEEIATHHRAAGLAPPTRAGGAPPPTSPPLSPADSLAKIHVRRSYHAELAAAEPLTVDPVAIDWDAAGRLWVVEMADYPLGLDGKGQPGGRVRCLEDTDGDGRYDRSTLFAEGLSFPNGILAWRDGVLVTAAPEILFLRDTNGDGRADSREVLVSGLTEGNQQLRANGLRWGLDNWVYCASGGHHGNYGVGTKLRTRTGETLVGSRDFRFRPDTGELEPESGPSQYGRNRDDYGHWFGTQNIRPLWHFVLADRYLRRNPHIAAPDPTHLVVVPLSPKVWPASPQEKRYHSFDEAGHFTSACSGMIYRDTLLFGAESEGRLHAFTCEPFHNLVQHNVVTEDGVTFAAARAPEEDQTEFFASEDRWCRPVMTRTGPDGALWVVDMYRYMIEHPDWLPNEGKAELLPHYRLGDDRGRIYRVVPDGAPTRRAPRLDTLNTPGLVAALDATNEWQRDTAHQLLVQRADPAAAPALRNLARNSANPLARVHALCVLDGLNQLAPETVISALADPHPGVRENALRLAEKRPAREVVAAAVKLVADPSAKVRLQLALTLGEWPDAAAGAALGRLAVSSPADAFLRAAVLSSAAPHCRALIDAAVTAGDSALDALVEPLVDLSLARQERDALAALLAPTLDLANRTDAVRQLSTISRFLAALARRQTSLTELTQGNDALARRLADLPAMLSVARTLAADDTSALPSRSMAARLLTLHPSTRKEAFALLAAWLTPRQPQDLQQAAITTLAATGDDSVPETLLGALPSLAPVTRVAVVDALLTRESWARAMLERGSREIVTALDASRRAQLLRHPSARVRELVGRLVEPLGHRGDVVTAYRPALQLPGDATRGREVFARLCVTCHRLGDLGTDVGPDLVSVAAHPPEKLLANILDPSADVQPGYQAYQCELSDGTELYGLITSETGNSVTFKLADGTSRTVLRKDVASLRGSNVSLMPDGLETGLTHQDLADLMGFLRTPVVSPAKQ